jgi:hypothetical protein
MRRQIAPRFSLSVQFSPSARPSRPVVSIVARRSRLSAWGASSVIALLFATAAPAIYGQSQGLVNAPSTLGAGSQARTAEYNAEWVESSSPVPGGVVSTTHFPSTGNTLTTVRENVAPIGASSPVLTSAPLPQAAGMQPMNAPNYAAIPNGNGGYLVPTVQNVPMNSGATGAPYQVAAAPYATCASCQTPMLVQPTAFQPGLVQQPFANQQPVLPQSGGVYGPMQQQVAPNYPGFYPVPQTQPQSGQGGYRALIPRSLPAGTYIGQGWAGQPKAYVSSQPFRNFMRYLILP